MKMRKTLFSVHMIVLSFVQDEDANEENSNTDDNCDDDDDDLVLSQFVCVGAGGQESPLES